MQIAENGHLLISGMRLIGIQGVVVVGDAELAVGPHQSLVQHLFFFIAHIRYQEAKEDQ